MLNRFLQRIPPAHFLALFALFFGAEWLCAQGNTSGLPETQATDAEPPATMFPHPAGGRWWVSGQANVIFQVKTSKTGDTGNLGLGGR